MKAAGSGFKWSASGAPSWLDPSPSHGEIRDNESVDVAAKLLPAVQGLTPGTYGAQIAFKKDGPRNPIVQPVRLLVSLAFR